VAAFAVGADVRQEGVMPCRTPIRLRRAPTRQVSSEMSSMPLPPATPALLQTTWTLPKAS